MFAPGFSRVRRDEAPQDWRRYALLVVLIAGVLWGAVHLIGRSGVL